MHFAWLFGVSVSIFFVYKRFFPLSCPSLSNARTKILTPLSSNSGTAREYGDFICIKESFVAEEKRIHELIGYVRCELSMKFKKRGDQSSLSRDRERRTSAAGEGRGREFNSPVNKYRSSVLRCRVQHHSRKKTLRVVLH